MINHEKEIFLFFCLPSIVVGYPSIRRRGLAFQSIIPKFKMNASSIKITRPLRRLQSIRECDRVFSLLVRNPSTGSVITMDSQWTVSSGMVFSALMLYEWPDKYNEAFVMAPHEKKIGHRDCSPWAHGDQNGHSQPWLSHDLGHDWAVT